MRSIRPKKELEHHTKISLPKMEHALVAEDFYIDNDIFHQIPALLEQAQANDISLRPNLKFCRNIGKNGDMRQQHQSNQILLKIMSARGKPVYYPLSISIELQHSILIQRELSSLYSHDNINEIVDTEYLAVYLLCEAKNCTTTKRNIGFRDRNRKWTQTSHLNYTVKGLVRLGSVNDFLDYNTTVDWPKNIFEQPTLAVYKHRIVYQDNKNIEETSEYAPYLGPSLEQIAESNSFTEYQTMEMCIAFFECILSEYDKNNHQDFCDIKPSNFCYDITHKTCEQCDKKAIGDPKICTDKYLPRWLQQNHAYGINTRYTGPREYYTLASRDLWAMACSLNKISGNIQPLIKIATDMKKIANKTKLLTSGFSNQQYIKETVLPNLRKVQKTVSPDIKLDELALEYIKTKMILPDNLHLPVNESNKAIFVCAVLGAKAYLDQHERKGSQSKGKKAVEEFLKKIIDFDPDAAPQIYTHQIRQQIEKTIQGSDSAPCSRFFSLSSRRHMLRTYCPSSLTDEYTGKTKDIRHHINMLTQMRLTKIFKPNREQEAFTHRMYTMLLGSRQDDTLQSKVLQTAVQYLECSKAGYFGKKAIREFIYTLCQEENMSNEDICEQISLVTKGGLFSRAKMRKEFFAPYLATTPPKH